MVLVGDSGPTLNEALREAAQYRAERFEDAIEPVEHSDDEAASPSTPFTASRESDVSQAVRKLDAELEESEPSSPEPTMSFSSTRELARAMQLARSRSSQERPDLTDCRDSTGRDSADRRDSTVFEHEEDCATRASSPRTSSLTLPRPHNMATVSEDKVRTSADPRLVFPLGRQRSRSLDTSGGAFLARQSSGADSRSLSQTPRQHSDEQQPKLYSAIQRSSRTVASSTRRPWNSMLCNSNSPSKYEENKHRMYRYQDRQRHE